MNKKVLLVMCLVNEMKEEEKEPSYWETEESKEKEILHTLTHSASSSEPGSSWPHAPRKEQSKEWAPMACLVSRVSIWIGFLLLSLQYKWNWKKETKLAFIFLIHIYFPFYWIFISVQSVFPIRTEGIQKWRLSLYSPQTPHCLEQYLAQADA